MRSLLLLLPLLGTALGDANSVKKQIQVIGDYTKLLSNDVTNASATIQGLPYALQVQQDAVQLRKQILIGAREAQNSANFGEPGSLDVANTLLNVSDTVKQTLNKTASKSGAFGGLGDIVLASLYQLQIDTNTFGNAIIDKLAPLEKAVGPVVLSDLNNSFNNAIRAYGGRTVS